MGEILHQKSKAIFIRGIIDYFRNTVVGGLQICGEPVSRSLVGIRCRLVDSNTVDESLVGGRWVIWGPVSGSMACRWSAVLQYAIFISSSLSYCFVFWCFNLRFSIKYFQFKHYHVGLSRFSAFMLSTICYQGLKNKKFYKKILEIKKPEI